MYRFVNSFKKLNISNPEIGLNYLALQVRWRRKPRWLPTARSKIFKVPVRPSIPTEEQQELKRLMDNYKTQIKSIRRFLTYRYGAGYQESSDPEQQRKIFEEDLIRCMEINEQWNAEQKILREQRAAKELEVEIAYAKNRLLEVNELKELEAQEAEEFIRHLKKEAETFITPENVDAAIEHALVNPHDYNFALDLEGNKIMGRETKPQIVEEKDKVAKIQ